MENKECFDLKKFTVILTMHILALRAFFFISGAHLGALFLVHSFFGIFGVSLGYHKYFSHRSIQIKKGFAHFLAVVCTLCFQGGPLYWAAAHRWHHRFTEGWKDPHSAGRGFFWSHMAWLFYRSPNGFSYKAARSELKDLNSTKFWVWLEDHSTLLNVLVLVFSFLLFKVIHQESLWFWVFPLRIVSVWHTTWFINSVCHGLLPFSEKKPHLTNSKILMLLLYGEGLHENHHRLPGRSNNAHCKGEIDVSDWLLKGPLKFVLKKSQVKQDKQDKVQALSEFEKIEERSQSAA